MANKSYSEKLLDPRWQKKRLEVLDSAEFQCEMCGDGESTLHVHHKQYFKGREVWDYEREQLACLCKDCHEQSHEQADTLKDAISRIPMDGPFNIDDVAFLIYGLLGTPQQNMQKSQRNMWAFGAEMAITYWRPHGTNQNS